MSYSVKGYLNWGNLYAEETTFISLSAFNQNFFELFYFGLSNVVPISGLMLFPSTLLKKKGVKMDNEYCIVITTYSEKELGQKIIDELIKGQLAACVQTLQIESFYHWKGEVNKDNEFLVLIKTRKELYEEVENCIRINHTYEIPEIIQIPVTTGFAGYMNWIDSVCK